MKADLCPVCRGVGRLLNPLSADTEGVQCYGCGGRGWVEVASGTTNDWCSVCGRSRYTPPSTACPAGSHFGAYVRIGNANSD